MEFQIFDTIYSYKKIIDSPYKIEYVFINSNNIKYSVLFQEIAITLPYDFTYWTIMFQAYDVNNIKTISLTKTGDELATFSTLIQILITFIDQYKPSLINFNTLYKKMNNLYYNSVTKLIEKNKMILSFIRITDTEFILFDADSITSNNITDLIKFFHEKQLKKTKF